ncbi:MAG: glycosyltransferase family 1 protein [Lachnospiraceae bacterium]|nr:glycosyltransferase family 1 protein [Lachnospiraceae bacterium]
MKKRNIGLILPTKPEDGGQHQYALLIVTCLWERKDTDYNLIALCGNSFWRKWCKEKKIKYLGCSFPNDSSKEQKFNFEHPLLAKIYYTYMTPFGRIMREEKIDILLSTQQGTFIPNYQVKIVSPVHDLMHKYEPHFPEVSHQFEQREIYMKCFAKYATCILVDSKLGKKQFEESYQSKSIRKPHVVSLPFVAAEHVWNQIEQYIEVPDKYVFYPAQFWKHKNHINLVKAIKLLISSIPDIHLVLVGSEKNSCREIKRYIADNDLENYITILGFVSNESITYLYRHAVGMIMPSYFGPTNIPPLEAMALGCPVAVSNKYAMPEQVGKAGLLFNPDSPEEIADCIKRLWVDEKLREKMKVLGYKRTQRWTKKEFGERLFRILKSI